jgi:hypothetical protein
MSEENKGPRILLLNNDGGGFADFINVDEGTTISQLVASKMPDRSPRDLSIRVRSAGQSVSEAVPADYVLEEGDRVSCTPNKVSGAR